MISIKQLSYALAVEQTLHFKKAADQCHISQSALSTALAELEKQLGFQIFERDNKKVLVTAPGQEVLDKARKILLEVEDLEHFSLRQKAPLSFPINIGVIPTIAPYWLPQIIPLLRQKYPDCEPYVLEDQSKNVVERVRRGDLDTAVIALPYPCDGLLTFEFWQEDFYWVTSNETSSFKGKKEIASKDLLDKNLLLLKEGHCLKDHILDVCKLPTQEANNGFGATSLATLIQMVINGMGTTLVPEIALKALLDSSHQLSAIHLKEPSPHRRLAFVIRPNYTRVSSIEALMELSKEAFRA